MKKLFLNSNFILALIIINAVTIFTGGFDLDPKTLFLINILDSTITVLFVIELIVKLTHFKFKQFFASSWNVFDLILIVISVPSLVVFIFNLNFADLGFLLMLRILRVFKTIRFFKFIPDIEDLMKGIGRALKTSVFVFIVFFLYIFIVGLFSFYLFRHASPEYFSDPLTALYSTFKIFTVDGWYVIPEEIASGNPAIPQFLIYIYFVFILLTGGVFGLSLVNSIFVEAMMSDNNDDLEEKVDILNAKIDQLINKDL